MVAYKYNPQNASSEELKQTFTAREQQLADILEELHQQRNSNTNQHYLVIGPRGIGKTNFLRMIYWTINNGCKNGECWLPIQFAEEEYSISSIRDFFEKILEALSSEDTSPEVIDYLNEVKEEKNDSVAYDKSYLFLKKYTTEHNKKILLLVDNLDLVIGDQINDDAEVKQLRSMLMNDNFLTLIGAAPTYFSEVSNYDKPLYNFFKLHNLDELTEEQIEELIRKRAEYDKKTSLLNALPTLRPKLKALRHLTGGNPRLILMLYQLLTLSEFMEVKEYLQGLLDDLTPYYQSKLQILSPQQRKIIDTMARAEGAVSPTELAGITRLNVNVVSTNLKRLLDVGYVKIPKQERRKATYYVISERMFRIWHQMRTSRSMKRKIQFFVEFVQMWFSQDELTDEATRLKNRFSEFLSSQDIFHAKDTIEHLSYIVSASTRDRFRNALNYEVIKMYVDVGDFDAAEQKLLERLQESKKNIEKNEEALCYSSLGYIYARNNNTASALKCFDIALSANPNDIDAWNNRGGVLYNIGKYNEAIMCCDEILKIKSNDFEAWMNRGNALFALDNKEEAIKNYDEALKIKSDDFEVWANRGDALFGLDRKEEAVISYGKALKIKPDNDEVWFNQGNALVELNRNEEAIESYKEALKVKPDYYDSWYNMGNSLVNVGRYEEALQSYEEALKGRPDDYEALYNRGSVLSGLGRYEEGLQSYDEALKIKSDLIEGWENRGLVLFNLGKYEEAIISYTKGKEIAKDAYVQDKLNWRLFGVYLFLTRLNIDDKKIDDVKKEFVNALIYLSIIKEDEIKKWAREYLFDYFKEIMSKENIPIINDFFSLLNEKDLNDEYEMVKPFVIATNYYESGKDAEVLDRLNPEMREIVEEIIQLAEKRSSENKELPK